MSCRKAVQGSGSKIQINNLAELPVDPKLLEMILNGQIQVVYNLNAKAVVQTLEGGEPSTGYISGAQWYLRNPGERGIHDSFSLPTQVETTHATRTIPANRNGRIVHIHTAFFAAPSAGQVVARVDVERVDGDIQLVTYMRIKTGETVITARGDGVLNLPCSVPLFAGDAVRVRLENGGAAQSCAFCVHIIEFDDGHTGTGGTP